MSASRKIYRWDNETQCLVQVPIDQVFDRRVEFDDGNMFLPSALQAAEARRIATMWDQPSIDPADLTKVQFQLDLGEIVEVEKRLRSRILDAFKIPSGPRDSGLVASTLAATRAMEEFGRVMGSAFSIDETRTQAGLSPLESKTLPIPISSLVDSVDIVTEPAPRKLTLPFDGDGLS